MPPAKKPTRKERDRQRNIDEILRAAESVFAEQGYEGARMADIAARAEFSVGYLYQTWDGKVDLYQSLLESKFKEFKSCVEGGIGSTTDPYQQINILIDAHVTFVEKNKEFAKIYLVETSPAERRAFNAVGSRLRKAHTAYIKLVAKIFEKGVDKGIFAPHPPRDLALALEGMIFEFAKDHFRNDPSGDLTDRIDVMKRIFFNPVLANYTKNTKNKKETRKP
ncbi:MAG: TetR/AcrR family transcriptional regulator [Candidatus Latescibacterota bacterium]|nr:MAG: TetR/AcrR family transcriptional regulator [Candidatus Latescibacterota bacterium]